MGFESLGSGGGLLTLFLGLGGVLLKLLKGVNIYYMPIRGDHNTVHFYPPDAPPAKRFETVKRKKPRKLRERRPKSDQAGPSTG